MRKSLSTSRSASPKSSPRNQLLFKSKEDKAFLDVHEVMSALAPAPRLRLSSEKAVIGVDYAGNAAYLGAVQGTRILGTCALKINDNPYVFFHTLINWLRSMVEEHNLSPELWIEDQFPSGRNIRAGQKLERMKTIVELAGFEAGMVPCFVNPGTWRKKIYGHGRPEDQKERARSVAYFLLDYETKHKVEHNMCEALLIAHYGCVVDDDEYQAGQYEKQESGSAQPDT